MKFTKKFENNILLELQVNRVSVDENAILHLTLAFDKACSQVDTYLRQRNKLLEKLVMLKGSLTDPNLKDRAKVQIEKVKKELDAFDENIPPFHVALRLDKF